MPRRLSPKGPTRCGGAPVICVYAPSQKLAWKLRVALLRGIWPFVGFSGSRRSPVIYSALLQQSLILGALWNAKTNCQLRKAAIHAHTVNHAYQQNDIVILDNHRIGHGREIYLGPKEYFGMHSCLGDLGQDELLGHLVSAPGRNANSALNACEARSST